jgi:PTS system nitrogen regulatory IIA component
MKISDFLTSREVIIDVPALDKRRLLKDLARLAASTLNCSAEEIASELLKREELGSTGMGNGVALPHARFQVLGKPFGIFARLTQPIDFDAIDERPVDLVFVLLLPATAQSDQLSALACAARRLRAPDELARLRSARTATEIYTSIIEKD